jgi:hypothetical protein
MMRSPDFFTAKDLDRQAACVARDQRGKLWPSRWMRLDEIG